jgi:hypothetical protein
MKAMLKLSEPKSLVPPGDAEHALIDAIVQTVAYADIFDYPLTADEVHRYLIEHAVSRDRVLAALSVMTGESSQLAQQDEYFTLTGREKIVDARRERSQRANRYWVRALRYGRLISSLPFVRMVAVTGELAMDNVRDGSDIDYFIVTEHRRLWLCRLMVVAVVRLAKLSGDIVCPNYLLSERVLSLSERDLYTAHEVVQMVPLSGKETYTRFRQANRWVYEFLPNAVSAPREVQARPHGRPARALAESALRTFAGEALERWESNRKLRKFAADSRQHAEASFSPDWCKGHVHDHGRLILAAFNAHGTDLEGTAR